jgi:hypothetical protein
MACAPVFPSVMRSRKISYLQSFVGWIVSSQNSYVGVLTIETQKVTLFGNRVIADIIG